MDMKIPIIPIIGLAMLQVMASAQNDIPLLRPEEQQAVDAQTAEFNQALTPALTAASKSTVRVWAGRRRLAYGTVVGDGRSILTKWSEVARASGFLRVESSDGQAQAALVSGVYEDEDLAVLKISGTPLTPVKWSTEMPPLGAFIAASQPNGQAAAFGVVSVLERNLRDTDQAFLGIVGDPAFTSPGVKIREVAPDSGAAKAGLQAGQVILKVGDRTISGLLELKNALIGVTPGSNVSLLVQTRGGEKTFTIQSGKRPQLPNFPDDRLRQMEQMGGPISKVRDAFTRVIQSDMRPQPDQIGGPVADLQGRVVGITMARADRTRAFIMPGAAVENLLLKDAREPALAQVRRSEEHPSLDLRKSSPRGRMQGGESERTRRHLSQMQRLLYHLRDELAPLEQEP